MSAGLYLSSCEETGQLGINVVETTGHNAWLEEAEQGENQTYLLLQVSLTRHNSAQFTILPFYLRTTGPCGRGKSD